LNEKDARASVGDRVIYINNRLPVPRWCEITNVDGSGDVEIEMQDGSTRNVSPDRLHYPATDPRMEEKASAAEELLSALETQGVEAHITVLTTGVHVNFPNSDEVALLAEKISG
jgi:hypothetical protein